MAFTLHLTSNWISRVLSEKTNDDLKPILQVTDVSKVKSLNKPAYLQRCVLSDGNHCVWALLHPSFKTVLSTLSNAVVKLIEFTIVDIPSSDSQRLITITKLETIATLPQIIGSPKFWMKESKKQEESINDPSPILSSLIEDYKVFYKERMEFSDVTFIVGKKSFLAHKIILAARSAYFRALLANRMKESLISEPPEIHLDFDPEIFALVLKWIYTDEIIIPPPTKDRLEDSVAWQLWMASNFFCLPTLQSIVECHLSYWINSENVCYFWNHLQNYETRTLQNACKKYFCSNLRCIMNTSGFLLLERRIVRDIFYTKDADASGVSNHFSLQVAPFVAQAVCKWVSHNGQEKIMKRKIEDNTLLLPPAKRKFA